MRLIDADAFIRRLRETCEDKATRMIVDKMGVFVEVEATFHPVAEPTRHGKLMRTEAYPHKLYCGECYNTLIPNDEAVEQNWMLKPKYCMYCGVKLDEEEL